MPSTAAASHGNTLIPSTLLPGTLPSALSCNIAAVVVNELRNGLCFRFKLLVLLKCGCPSDTASIDDDVQGDRGHVDRRI